MLSFVQQLSVINCHALSLELFSVNVVAFVRCCRFRCLFVVGVFLCFFFLPCCVRVRAFVCTDVVCVVEREYVVFVVCTCVQVNVYFVCIRLRKCMSGLRVLVCKRMRA